MNARTTDRLLAPETLARVTVQARAGSLAPILALAVELARPWGFDERGLDQIRLIVEEAYNSVLQSAFEPGDDGEISFEVAHRPGALVFTFEDHGLPVDLRQLEESDELYLNFRLLRGFTDGLTFTNGGPAGKQLQLVKNLSRGFETPEDVARAGAEAAAEATAEADEAPELRFIRADETLALAQLAYRTYGYTYVSDFYLPEKIAERLASGLMRCAVAVLPSGRIVGALCLFYAEHGARVAESGAAMVEPRFRGHDLFKRLKQFLFARGREEGLCGIFSEAVTIHPYTQKGNLAIGAVETGLLLSYIRNMAFKNIDGKLSGERQATVYYYAPLNPAPHRTVHAPAAWRELIASIHGKARLPRTLLDVEEAGAEAPARGHGQTRLAVHMRSEIFNDAQIGVQEVGADALALIAHHTRKLCEGSNAVIYLDLPMGDPAAMALALPLGTMGFLFAGVIPEQRDGDILKLQFLNRVPFDPQEVRLVSPHGQALLRFINAQYQELQQRLPVP